MRKSNLEKRERKERVQILSGLALEVFIHRDNTQ